MATKQISAQQDEPADTPAATQRVEAAHAPAPTQQLGRQPDRWLTAKDASRITGYSVNHLAYLRANGEGPPFAKMGRGKTAQVRYLSSDLDAWFEARKSTSSARESA